MKGAKHVFDARTLLELQFAFLPFVGSLNSDPALGHGRK